MISFLVCEKMLFTVEFGISNLGRRRWPLKLSGLVGGGNAQRSVRQPPERFSFLAMSVRRLPERSGCFLESRLLHRFPFGGCYTFPHPERAEKGV
jgi:hypothetical protein